MKKRVIFDLDGTLLTNNFRVEDELFRNSFGEQGSILLASMGQYLGEYENHYPLYEVNMLAEYLTQKTGVVFDPKFIQTWIHELAFIDDTLEDGILELLEDYKRKNKSLAVLTNWFGETQISRLKRSGLYEFFDDVYTGDLFLKPQKRAYMTSIAHYEPKDCLFIGDSVERDYIGPRACGLDSILYDKNDSHHKTLKKVRHLNELKKIK